MKTVTLSFPDDQYNDHIAAFNKAYPQNEKVDPEENFLTQLGNFATSVTKVSQVDQLVEVEKARIQSETNYTLELSTDTASVSVTTEVTEPTDQQIIE